MSSAGINLPAGSYIVDWNYPVCHLINFFCLFVHCYHMRKYIQFGLSPPGGINPLYLESILVNSLIMLLLVLGVVINEKMTSASVTASSERIQEAMMVINILLTFSDCTWLTHRSFRVVKDKGWKYAGLAANSILTIAITIVFAIAVKYHIDLNGYIAQGDIDLQDQAKYSVSLLTMVQILLFCIISIGNTIFIILYVGRKLVETKGYVAYLKSSMTAIVGGMLILYQFLLLILTIMIFTKTITPFRSYMHMFNATHVLFTYFFYYATVSDVGHAVRENNKVMAASTKGTQLSTNSAKPARKQEGPGQTGSASGDQTGSTSGTEFKSNPTISN